HPGIVPVYEMMRGSESAPDNVARSGDRATTTGDRATTSSADRATTGGSSVGDRASSFELRASAEGRSSKPEGPDMARPAGRATSSEEQPFYTMRFLQGHTLTTAVEEYHRNRAAGKAGSFEFIALLNAFVSVCNTVAYAHARDVIHRDLKGQ